MNLKGSSVGLASFATIVLGFLKSRGTIDISWAVVFIPLVLYFVGMTFAFIKLFIKELSNTNVPRNGKKK